ncbi:hypothetical protein [Arthrobacter sp. LjRoot14]|uniref:hypothetical protein n=1 Tax=Arthrobacter sp. LjRoot14 TaxID=3342265 RepID=UPI003ED02032
MTLGSLLKQLDRGRTSWMVVASLAVLAGTASMIGALLSQATGKDAEPYLAGGVLGLAGGYAVATLGGVAANRLGTRVRLLRDWRRQPRVVQVLTGLTTLGALASVAAMLMAFTGALGPLRPTSLASAAFYPAIAASGWAHALAAAGAAQRDASPVEPLRRIP